MLTEGTSRVSVYDDATKRWSEREYVVRRHRQLGALKRSVPEHAPPFCEAKWTAEGQHELEVPKGEACTVTIDGISRIAV